jgi:hypothetical protein
MSKNRGVYPSALAVSGPPPGRSGRSLEHPAAPTIMAAVAMRAKYALKRNAQSFALRIMTVSPLQTILMGLNACPVVLLFLIIQDV